MTGGLAKYDYTEIKLAGLTRIRYCTGTGLPGRAEIGGINCMGLGWNETA